MSSSFTLRETCTEVGGDIYLALLSYKSNSKWFKAFIYFVRQVVENDLYFNYQIPPWEISPEQNKTIPRLDDILSDQPRFPVGFNNEDEVK